MINWAYISKYHSVHFIYYLSFISQLHGGKYRNDIVAESQSASYWRVVPPLDVVFQVLLAVHRVMCHAASQMTRSLKDTGFSKSAFYVRVCGDSPSLVALVGRHICEFLRPSPPNVRNSILVWRSYLRWWIQRFLWGYGCWHYDDSWSGAQHCRQKQQETSQLSVLRYTVAAVLHLLFTDLTFLWRNCSSLRKAIYVKGDIALSLGACTCQGIH